MTDDTYARQRRGRPQKYPWDYLLDGNEKLVTTPQLAGWGVTTATFRSTALAEALRRKIRLRTRSMFDGAALVLAFPAPSLFAQSKVDWSRYFDGRTHGWTDHALPFGLEAAAWLERLTAEATKAGHEALAAHDLETGAVTFAVVSDRPAELADPLPDFSARYATGLPVGPTPAVEPDEPEPDEEPEPEPYVEDEEAIMAAHRARIAEIQNNPIDPTRPYVPPAVVAAPAASSEERPADADEESVPIRVVLGQ